MQRNIVLIFKFEASPVVSQKRFVLAKLRSTAHVNNCFFPQPPIRTLLPCPPQRTVQVFLQGLVPDSKKKKRFAIVIAKYFRNLCWKTISIHNCKLVLSLKTTIPYIFIPKNKICRNIALKITKYGKIFILHINM